MITSLNARTEPTDQPPSIVSAPALFGWLKDNRSWHTTQVPVLEKEVLVLERLPSTFGVFDATNNHYGGSDMEITSTQQLIKQLKDAKREREITFPRLMEMLEKIGKPVSLTTLRRVFADGSEWNDSFNYESTLLPLAEVLINAVDIPVPTDSPYATEIEGLKSVIHVQNEWMKRMR